MSRCTFARSAMLVYCLGTWTAKTGREIQLPMNCATTYDVSASRLAQSWSGR